MSAGFGQQSQAAPALGAAPAFGGAPAGGFGAAAPAFGASNATGFGSAVGASMGGALGGGSKLKLSHSAN